MRFAYFVCTQHFSQTIKPPYFEHPRLPAYMPTYQPPACAICVAETESSPATQALFVAVDMANQVQEAAAERPETSALEMLAIVATEVAKAGQS